jgi:hypothetical protein
VVTTTRAQLTPALTALLIGLFAAACSGGDTGGETSADIDSPLADTSSEDSSGNSGPDATRTQPDVAAPVPDVDEPVPDVDEPVPGSNWPNVVINEVAANGAPADWIELLNRSGETVDLDGWILTDDDPVHVHALSGTMGAGAYLLLLRDDAGGFTFGLGGTDAVNLYAPDDALVDSTDWVGGQSPTDHTWARIPNGTGDFMTLETPTPGGANAPNTPMDCGNGSLEFGEVCDGAALDGESCETFNFASGQLACAATCDAFDSSACVAPSRVIVINEATSTDDDRIELFNPGFGPVVIANWILTDKSDEPTAGAYVFPGGSVLGAGEFLVLTKDINHLFGLGGNDKVKLRNDDGLLIDILNWPDGEAVVSYCLVPNGGDAAQACEAQSFGASND